MGALRVVVPQHAELEEPPGSSWEEMGPPGRCPGSTQVVRGISVPGPSAARGEAQQLVGGNTFPQEFLKDAISHWFSATVF